MLKRMISAVKYVCISMCTCVYLCSMHVCVLLCIYVYVPQCMYGICMRRCVFMCICVIVCSVYRYVVKRLKVT